ncbi:MAG: TetR family transcriptional regulator [Alphaproteobacteria bacterium]|nr:MAG: TetR family transcriptional regulator [Alphaproteobacteria bacterium]
MSEKKIDIKQKILDSALHLAVEQGWEYTTLRDIAEHAGVSASDLYDTIDDKNDVLVILGRKIDKEIMGNIDLSDDGATNSRDRLFDIMMDRYEALNEYREGVVSILESFKCDPKQAVISMPHLCKSMGWMLEVSGIETAGIKGALKVVGLTGVYIKVLKVWAEDESADLSKTMSALDKALERAEKAANILGF